ncbi:hypothetical protein SCA6_004134 [Theobroma cacao]
MFVKVKGEIEPATQVRFPIVESFPPQDQVSFLMADNILASCLAGAVSQAGADLTNYAKSKVSLSQSMEKNYEMLRNEVARLQALRDDYEREVKKHKMKTTTSSYDVWRRCVNKTLENAKELEDRFEEDRRPSSRYIHVKRRSNYSGKLVKMYEEIQKLVEEGKFLGGILVDKPVDPVLKVHAPEIKGFPSLQRPLEQIQTTDSQKNLISGKKKDRGEGKGLLIKVHPLSSNEAWKMFQQMVSDVVDLPDIEPVAQLVAKECARLPLLIKTVAGAFKLKDSVPEWRKGLKDLRKWPEIEIPGLTELHSFLKFCYDQLKDDQKRKCFLYGALYPAESKIYTDYLLECWTAEGLVGNTNEKRRFQDARDEGFDTLKYLTNVSLLEKGERMIYVQMNNSIRQVALYISSQDPDCKFLTGMTENSPDCLEENDWQQAKRISMIDKKLRDLPESPNCNMLLSLLLQRNSNLTGIPQSFFENMKKLLVLDLYGTVIESLPSSLAKLTGLKGLYLNNCINVTELPSEIGELNCLEVLDIRGCRISFIPFHIQKLINLRCLRISYYRSSNLNHCQDMDIDCNVIPLLARLEELMIDVGSYDHWCNEVVEVMRQVATLENLTTLRICFPRSEVLKTFMQHSPSWKDRQQLTSFRFFVGCQNRKRPQILECFKYKINRYLGYFHGNYSDDSTICDLLAETDALELVEHKDIKSLTDFGNVASFNRIRGCLIERCNKMTTITDNNRTEGRDILPNLEQLHLVNLRSLQTIFEGSLSTKSLSKLHTVVVTSCPMLTKVFSLRVIQQLSVLRKLAIQKCAKLEVLIEKPDSVGQVSPAFPNLETLILIEMPKLRTICVDKSLAWPSLKELQVYMCPELKSLPFDKDNAAYLKSIEAEQVWWEALHWPQNEVKEQLQSMCNLR